MKRRVQNRWHPARQRRSTLAVEARVDLLWFYYLPYLTNDSWEQIIAIDGPMRWAGRCSTTLTTPTATSTSSPSRTTSPTDDPHTTRFFLLAEALQTRSTYLSCMMNRDQELRSLVQLLDRVGEAARDGDRVSLDKILGVVGRRSFGLWSIIDCPGWTPGAARIRVHGQYLRRGRLQPTLIPKHRLCSIDMMTPP